MNRGVDSCFFMRTGTQKKYSVIADGVLRGARIMKKFMTTTFTDLILNVVLAKLLFVSFGTVGI